MQHDHRDAENRDCADWNMNETGQQDHAPAEYPDDLREAEELCIVEVPENQEANHRELEHDQPQSTRHEEARHLRLRLAARKLEVDARPREKHEHRGAE